MFADFSLRKRMALEAVRKIRKNNIELHPLRQLFWECTLRCNLNCLHCGSECKREVDQEDMPLEDFLKVIDSITPHVNPHEVSIIISGGEPLLRDDLEECGLELYERGYPWGFVTNGLYFSRARLDMLLAAGLHSVTISLDGFADEHNWLRRHSESFRQATKAIEMLAGEEELIWDVVTCVNSRNYSYLPALKNYLINLGVRNWRLFTISPIGRASEFPELQLSNKDFRGLLEFIRKSRKTGLHISYGCEGFLGEYEGEVRDHFYSCNAGVSVASILIDGSISGCPSIRNSNFCQGNIYKDDFMEVWENHFEQLRNREWAKKGKCANCKLFRYCEGNGIHLRNENSDLLVCHYEKLKDE